MKLKLHFLENILNGLFSMLSMCKKYMCNILDVLSRVTNEIINIGRGVVKMRNWRQMKDGNIEFMERLVLKFYSVLKSNCLQVSR